MAFCNQHGIPHSIFLGRVWPNPSSPGDPYWLESDVEKALAFSAHQNLTCPRCGTRNSDWVDEDGFPRSDPPYTTDTYKCHGCYELEQANDSIPQKAKATRAVIVRREGTKIPGIMSSLKPWEIPAIIQAYEGVTLED